MKTNPDEKMNPYYNANYVNIAWENAFAPLPFVNAFLPLTNNNRIQKSVVGDIRG